MDQYRPMIDAYLEEDDYQATWVFDKLVRMGYKGSYSTVKETVREIKGEKTRIAYIRFETEPAFQAQVDWGDFQIEEPDGIDPYGLRLRHGPRLFPRHVRRVRRKADA